MKARKTRRPLGPVGYTLCWIGAIWLGLGFLGEFPKSVLQFLQYCATDKGMALGYLSYLGGELIVGAIAVFCILEIRDTNRARKALKEAQAAGPNTEKN